VSLLDKGGLTQEALGDALFVAFSMCFLFISVLLLTGDGIIVVILSVPFSVAKIVAGVGILALGIHMLVSHSKAN